MYRKTSFFLLLILLTGCLQLKSNPTSVHLHIDQNVNDFETALENLDYTLLKKLLAEELTLNYETVNKDDLNKILQLLGDYDLIDKAILTELQRTMSDNRVIIDAELYLELIKNQEKLVDTKTLSIIIENLGTKWTGDRWLITSITYYAGENYQYVNPAIDPDEILERLSHVLKTKTYLELPDLLSYTLITSDGTAVNYYRNNQQFIGLLANDLKDIKVTAAEFTNRYFSLEPQGIEIKTDLEATFEVGGITKTGQVTITLTVIEIPEGLVINRLFYPGKFFGLL